MESTDFNQSFTIDDIVTKAYRKCGELGIEEPLDSLSSAKRAHGQESLKLIVDSLLTRGLFAKSLEFIYIDLVSGQFKYTLPSTTLLVEGDGMYIAPGEDEERPDSETFVRQVHVAEWHRYTAKNVTTDRPTWFAANRPTPNEVWVWPEPNESGGKIRVHAQMLYPSTKDGGKELSFRTYWTRYFVWELAHELSQDLSMTMEQKLYIKKEAAEQLKYCRIHAMPRVMMQARIEHPTPMSRFR